MSKENKKTSADSSKPEDENAAPKAKSGEDKARGGKSKSKEAARSAETDSAESKPAGAELSAEKPELAKSVSKPADVEPSKSTSAKTTESKPIPATAKVAPPAAEPVPKTAEPVPTPAKPVPESAEPVPTPAESVPNAAKPVPNAAKPVPKTAVPVPTPAEPVPPAIVVNESSAEESDVQQLAQDTVLQVVSEPTQANANPIDDLPVAGPVEPDAYSDEARRDVITSVQAMLRPTGSFLTRAELIQASRELKRVTPYNYEAWRLHADLLLDALRQLETRQIQPDETFKILTIPLREDDIRDAAEAALRQCAHHAPTEERRIKLIDEANSVRRLTWF